MSTVWHKALSYKRVTMRNVSFLGYLNKHYGSVFATCGNDACVLGTKRCLLPL
jgi:hypothetical protein